MRRLTRIVLGMAIGFVAFAAACGGDDTAGDTMRTATASSSPMTTATAVVSTEATPVPTELRVAFINLMSPVSVDATNPAAGDTYDQRLGLIIEELKAFKPDLVAFNEATNTRDHGDAVATLAKELKMEQQKVRSNPWFPNADKAQNDEIAKQSGFEEFEVILARANFPILKADPFWLNPRTSETEGRAALHVVVKTGTAVGNVDVYVTHLTGGGDKVRAQQTASVLGFIKDTRGTGPLVLMGDLSDIAGSGAYKALVDAGLRDLGDDKTIQTCCREAIIGEQPPVAQRTDFIFTDRFAAVPEQTWADQPVKRADGSLLYASDHNGLKAVFPLSMMSPP
jgi:endonuclease/exonuclease/phosphatase family metal-dependent hydrolase